MKTILLSVCFCLTQLISLVGQEFQSEPFGREIIELPQGFNYVGLRFHRQAVTHGQITTVTSGSTVVGIPRESLDLLNTTDSFLFEVESGDALGAVIPVLSYDLLAETITLSDDLSMDIQVGDRYVIRPSATLASVFGENNESGLQGASISAGADKVLIPDGVGGFTSYYFRTLGFGVVYNLSLIHI